MSSLCKKNLNILLKLKERRPSPTPQNRNRKRCLARDIKYCTYIKRIPLPYPSMKFVNGSMTVEAAVVVPLFLFFFLNLMSAFEMIRLHGNVELALWENGRILSACGYAYGQMVDGESLLPDLTMYHLVRKDLGEEYLEQSPLTYGKNGLVFLESSYGEDDCIDVKVTYQVSPLFRIPGFASFRMANRYYARAWTGYRVGKEATQAEYVYVTPNGEVYHLKSDCSYLTRVIKAVRRSEIYKERNSYGERYELCRICREIGWGMVYVTPDGNKYHESKDCPSLVRTILTIERGVAEKRFRLCSKCVMQKEK